MNDQSIGQFDAVSISSGFDSGNIIFNGRKGASFDLAIARDHQSDFYQWFHFRLSGAKGVPVTRVVSLRRYVPCRPQAMSKPSFAKRVEWLPDMDSNHD